LLSENVPTYFSQPGNPNEIGYVWQEKHWGIPISFSMVAIGVGNIIKPVTTTGLFRHSSRSSSLTPLRNIIGWYI
jgi:hypothetical protein